MHWPHEPPHPSGPQLLPAHWGAQAVQWPPLQVSPSPQAPQLPLHASEPHSRPVHCAVQAAQVPWAVSHGVPAAQLPHVPPQPSGPHVLPVHTGVHARHTLKTHAPPVPQSEHWAPPLPHSLTASPS